MLIEKLGEICNHSTDSVAVCPNRPIEITKVAKQLNVEVSETIFAFLERNNQLMAAIANGRHNRIHVYCGSRVGMVWICVGC